MRQVKTVDKSEADVIERKAAAYLNHLRNNPQSYLRHTATLGLFAVSVYGYDTSPRHISTHIPITRVSMNVYTHVCMHVSGRSARGSGV